LSKTIPRSKTDGQKVRLISKLRNKIKNIDKQYIPNIYKKTILWKPLWFILSFLGILFEIIFYFAFEAYKERPVTLYGAIIAYIILGICGVVLAHFLTKFYDEFLTIKKSFKDKLIKTQSKGTKLPSTSKGRREKTRKILKLIFTFPYIISIPFFGVVFFVLIIISMIVVKTGVLYPPIASSYFMIIFNYIFFITYFLVIFAYLSGQFQIVFSFINLFNRIDIQELEFPNNRKDPPEGFKKIGLLILKLPTIFLVTAGTTLILTSFEILFNLNITVGISLLPESWVDSIIRHNLNYFYICMPIILFVTAFLPPQIQARRTIKKFKEAKLSPLRKRRRVLLNELTSKTKDPNYLAKLNEIEKTDHLITQIELIRNWTLNIGRNITFLIGNLIAIILGFAPFLIDFLSKK